MNALAVAAAVALAGATVAAYRAAAPQARPTETPCKPAAAHAPAVGKIERTSGTVYQGKNRIKTDDAKLLTNATLCTVDGRASFLVTPLKRTSCEMRPDARLRLYPPKQKKAHRQVVIRFEDGKTYCGTGKDASDREVKYDARKGQVRLLMKDPLFAVDVHADRTLVQVELGYIEVSRGLGEGALILGPGQQVSVPELATPGQVKAIDKTPDDQTAFDALRPTTPTPDFSRPRVDGSSALTRVFTKRAIFVGVDPVGDKARTEFVRTFFAFLGKSWGVRAVTREGATATLVRELGAQNLDIAVTSNTNALGPFDTLPFFASAPRLWHVAIVRDEIFLAALRRFVRAAVSAGNYRSAYRSAFAAEPPLDPLRPILFP